MGRRPASNLRRTIRTSELSYGGYRASTRHRDEDGKVRTVSAHGLTIADAEALLESKLKNRVIPTTAARGHPDVTDVILAEHTVRQAARIWLSKIDSDPTLADTTKLDYARIVRATLENRTGVGTVRLRDLTAGVIGRHIDGIANGTLRMSPALRKQSGTKDGPAPTQARNCRKVLRQIPGVPRGGGLSGPRRRDRDGVSHRAMVSENDQELTQKDDTARWLLTSLPSSSCSGN